MMKNIFKILLVDDQVVIRYGLRVMLEDKYPGTVVIYEASNGTEVLRLISDNEYDIILMDLEMPKLDGLSTLKKLREKGIKTPIIVFSVHQKKNIVKQVLEEGADGYVIKNIGSEELIKAIDTVCEGKPYYSNEIAQVILSSEEESKKSLGLEIELTKREMEVLKLLAEDLSSQQIADELEISYRTVEGHRINLKSKLQVRSSVGLVRYAFQCGLV